MSDGTYVGDVTPKEAWAALTSEPTATLVDVRTDAEWNFVGTADLSDLGKEPVLVPWQVFPTMEQNPEFAAALSGGGLATDTSLYFICRSGARSRNAAIAMTAAGYTRCFNVASGFEGDADASRHRGNGQRLEGRWPALGAGIRAQLRP